jgi:hypothetical protein
MVYLVQRGESFPLVAKEGGGGEAGVKRISNYTRS